MAKGHGPTGCAIPVAIELETVQPGLAARVLRANTSTSHLTASASWITGIDERILPLVRGRAMPLGATPAPLRRKTIQKFGQGVRYVC